MKPKAVTVLVLFLLVLAACAVNDALPENELEESEVTAARPTRTVTVRATVVVERPSVTPTAQSTPTFAPASALGPRPAATATPYASPTRTNAAPPTTPAAPAQAYHLKDWTEQEAQAAIAEAYGAVWESIPRELHYPAGYFYLMAREALLRFPNLRDRSEIVWGVRDLVCHDGIVSW